MDNKIFFILVMFSTLIMSCSSPTRFAKEIAFENTVSIRNPNTKIGLSLYETQAGPKIGDTIDLILKNKSKSMFVFPKDYGIKIFSYVAEKNEWIPIENNITYASYEDMFLFPKDKGPMDVRGVPVSPVISEEKQAIDIRILVVGNMYLDDASLGDQATAFIDITLNP